MKKKNWDWTEKAKTKNMKIETEKCKTKTQNTKIEKIYFQYFH